MLAFMSQSRPLPDFDMPTSFGNSMSLTLLPSAPQSYGQPPLPSEVPTSPSPSKRPKLSLNTSSVAPVFGKGSTSLRLETLSATSPTARNTFRNRQDPNRALGGRGKSRRPGLAPLVTNVQAPTPSIIDTPTPSKIELPDSAVFETAPSPATSPATSATSVSTVGSISSEVPYKLPFNAQSILRNGPLPRTRSRRLSFSQSRPMFPAAKKVAFRTQLTEEIENSKYTLRHSDIESVSIESQDQDQDQDQEENQNDQKEAIIVDTTSSPLAGGKRNSIDDDDEESASCPATPVAGRRKRDREWVWTLGPIQNQQPEELGVSDGERKGI